MGTQSATSALCAEQAAHPEEPGDVACVTHPGTSLTRILPCAQKATGAASVGIVTLAPGALKEKKEQLLETVGRKQPTSDTRNGDRVSK